MSLEGKTVVVVGGSSGIGLASAAAAAAEGARVVIAGRSEERLSAAPAIRRCADRSSPAGHDTTTHRSRPSSASSGPSIIS